MPPRQAVLTARTKLLEAQCMSVVGTQVRRLGAKACLLCFPCKEVGFSQNKARGMHIGLEGNQVILLIIC
jgi:hypothetical protein